MAAKRARWRKVSASGSDVSWIDLVKRTCGSGARRYFTHLALNALGKAFVLPLASGEPFNAGRAVPPQAKRSMHRTKGVES
jgi:hypothetical protein